MRKYSKKEFFFTALVVSFFSLILLLFVSFISSSIKYYPSCATFYSEKNVSFKYEFDNFDKIHRKLALVKKYSGDEIVEYSSENVTVNWSKGVVLWVNVCTKNENSDDWLIVSEEIRKIFLRNMNVKIHMIIRPLADRCNKYEKKEYSIFDDFEKIKKDFRCY